MFWCHSLILAANLSLRNSRVTRFLGYAACHLYLLEGLIFIRYRKMLYEGSNLFNRFQILILNLYPFVQLHLFIIYMHSSYIMHIMFILFFLEQSTSYKEYFEYFNYIWINSFFTVNQSIINFILTTGQDNYERMFLLSQMNIHDKINIIPSSWKTYPFPWWQTAQIC